MDRNKVKWLPPDHGVIKINFVGASQGNPGKSRIGVCLRNEFGHPIAMKSFDIFPGTNNIVEVSSLLQGLVLAKSLGFECIHVEGDSLIVIQACINRKLSNRSLGYIFNQIWQLLDEFKICVISHSYQEGNHVADYLSNMGCDSINIELLIVANCNSINKELNDIIIREHYSSLVSF